tara:strand:+ start:735 stop:5576 length:4842 start_codon:yes stop_codon:yes gene_type:complete
MSGTFNVFNSPTYRDIKVGYISTDTGYVSGVGLWDANLYAKANPGTTFIFTTREKTQYLNINEVNGLTPNDLINEVNTCPGVDINTVSNQDPYITFSGGGGVGAQANPVIGQDGSLIGIDLVTGGFGYKYPPQVAIKDPTGIAAGAVIRCGIGSTALVYQTYEDEEDFEEYFPPHVMELAPIKVGFGSFYSNGQNIGVWNPNKYINPEVEPFENQVKEYIDSLKQLPNPWWTTTLEPPTKVTGNGKTSRTYYKVEHGAWREFLNSYAISPVPPSHATGSDFAGRWYTFEWNVEFPYDGEYKFRAQCDNDARFFLDNKAVSQFKIGSGGAAGTVLSNPLLFQETIKEGKHNLRLELYNHQIKEKVVTQDGDLPGTKKETQVAGADFIFKGNGYYMLVGGNVETEVTLSLTYDDNPRTAGTAITKVIIPTPDGDVVLEREKNSRGNFKQSGSVSVKATLAKNEFGYGPFTIEGNDGSSKLVSSNKAYGPSSARYGQIDFLDRHGSDTNGSLKIIAAKNLVEERIVVVEPTSSESDKLTTIFNTIDYINKANRKLWRTNVNNSGGFVNEYGICPFDTLNTLPDNPYAGTHEIRWDNVNFPVSGNYVIEIAVDDNVTVRIGDQVQIRKEGFKPGTSIGTGKLQEIHYIKQGNYNIFAALEQVPGGKFGFGKIRKEGGIHDYSGDGLNPMTLAINIETSYEERQRVVPKSWHYNPMGVAMTIEAPASPPIPPLPPAPVNEGRCPPNPFWTTRSPGAKTQWHPVFVDGWSQFLNRFAMSPVPPYDSESTSGGGIVFDNEWDINIPYDGFYKLKGEADDISKFWIDGVQVLDTTRREDRVRGEKKIFLTEGPKNIRVEVENYLFEDQQLIDQKIFNTADWVDINGTTTSNTKQVDFKVTTNSAFINSIEIKGLFYKEGGFFQSTEVPAIPQPSPVTADVNFIKRGDQYFMSVTGNDLVEVAFEFRYSSQDPSRGGGNSVEQITIQTAGTPSTFRKTDGPKNLVGWPGFGGSVVDNAVFQNGNEYPLSFTGGVFSIADAPIIGPAGSLDNTSQEKPNKRINFFDNDTADGATSGPDLFGDVRAYFTIISIKQLSPPPFVQGPSTEKSTLVQLINPDPIVRKVEIGKVYDVEIKNAGQGEMGNYPAPLAALKVDGGVVMAEDLPNVDAGAQGGVTFDDIVCTASEGRFFDINKNKCKFIVEIKVPTAQGVVTGGTVRDGATYSGPKLATYAKGELGPFLSPFHTTPEEIQGKTWVMKWDNINFPDVGNYNLKMIADDVLKMRVDGEQVGEAVVGSVLGSQGTSIQTFSFDIADKGPKTVELELTNIRIPNTTFTENPTVAAALITRKVSVSVMKDGKRVFKSWKENPIGVSGILIPPPCPKVVGGTGICGPVVPIVPGNGYRPPKGPGYPVGLKLKSIEVDDPGINYNPDDTVEITPNDGGAKAHICEMDSYGRVKKVCLGGGIAEGDPDDGDGEGEGDGMGGGKLNIGDDGGVGFTDYPDITIKSPTGSSARLRPVFEIVRDPIDPGIDKDKLLQVTDLVGIKQTGYYEGRPYYGSVFYKNGIKYAGYYETAGELVQVYETLQESIDARVTTPSSAILRQGTDISSDDPRLNIPGTPNNLT